MADAPKEPEKRAPLPDNVSRRVFLKGAGGLAAGGALGSQAVASQKASAEAPAKTRTVSGRIEIPLSINGEKRKVSVEPRTTLLSLLRVHLQPPLTGTKLVCDRGACGACTVHLDGEPAYSCSLLAIDCVGREITTVEGLGAPDALSPVQQAFCEKDALMCGFCTPGFVMSVSACLEKNPAADDDEVRAACSGNLCRCGTYPPIFAAAQAAGRKLQGGR